jgi:hypothetical protein
MLRVRVFLSYRREDAAGQAGRLHDDLADRLGPRSVFQDVAGIAPGERYVPAIERAIAEADVVLAVMGRRWASVADDAGRPRLHATDDLVRHELETALASGRRVIPVLVDRGTLPARAAIPESLAALLDLNAVELRDEAWAADMDRLGAVLGAPQRRGRARRRRSVLAVAAAGTAAVAVLLVVLSVWLINGRGSPQDGGHAVTVTAPTATPAPLPSVTAARTGLIDHTGEMVWTLRRWWYQPAAGSNGATVTVELKVSNETNAASYVYAGRFNLLTGGINQGQPELSVVSGEDPVDPGQAELVRLRFDAAVADHPLVLTVGDDLHVGRITLSK